MKIKVFLMACICFIGSMVTCMAAPPKEAAPNDDGLKNVLNELSPIFQAFRDGPAIDEQRSKQLDAVSDAIDIRLNIRYNVPSVYLVPHDAVRNEYVDLVETHKLGNCRVVAGYIEHLCIEHNVDHYTLTVSNVACGTDVHTVVAVWNNKDERWDIIDFFNDVNNKENSIKPKSYDNYMKQRKLYNQPITACFVDCWDSEGKYNGIDVRHLNLGTVQLSRYCLYKEFKESPSGYGFSIMPFTKELQQITEKLQLLP